MTKLRRRRFSRRKSSTRWQKPVSFGIKVPKQYGGQGGDARSYVIVMEEIARVSGVASIYVSSPNSLSGGPFLLSGNAEQKEKYLRPVVTGEKEGLLRAD